MSDSLSSSDGKPKRLETIRDFTLDGVKRNGPFCLEFIDDRVYLNFIYFDESSLVSKRIEVAGKPKSTDDLKDFIFYSV